MKPPEYRDRALQILEEVVSRIGPSAETYGLMGRVYKDLLQDAAGRPEALGFPRKAIDAYTAGFEADWREAYPGINSVTLLDIEGSVESLAKKNGMLPVVRFAAERRLAGKPDYWDHATLLEIAILESDEAKARRILPDALACIREPWEPETTARNLRLIRETREKRDAAPVWEKNVEDSLLNRPLRS